MEFGAMPTVNALNWRHWEAHHLETSIILIMSSSSSSTSIYLPYFHIKLQIYIMQWQAIRKTQSSTSWRLIINRTVENILLCKNIQWNKKEKKTNRQRTRQRATRGI